MPRLILRREFMELFQTCMYRGILEPDIREYWNMITRMMKVKPIQTTVHHGMSDIVDWECVPILPDTPRPTPNVNGTTLGDWIVAEPAATFDAIEVDDEDRDQLVYDLQLLRTLN